MMHQLRFFGKSAVLVLFVVGLVASFGGWTQAWGQSNQGAIAGTVLDPSGFAVANASINAIGVDTGSQYHAISTGAGIYSFPSVNPGAYNVTVTATGFKKETRSHVVVQVGTTSALNITLHIGAASETVTVEADAPSVQTETSDLGYVMSEKQQLDLPLPLGGAVQYMREPESFVFLAPGTVGPGTSSGSGGTFESKISGGQSYSTEVLLDGSSTFRSENGSSFSETAPSVDALTEFKLTTSTLPAYLGRTTGGIESFSTKAGSNQFHGVAYDIIANTAFDANNWGHNLALGLVKKGILPASDKATYQRVADKQNDYGLTFGGPIRIPYLYNGHDRTFFFFSWEQLDIHGGGVATDTVPTVKELGGDFSELLTTTVATTNKDCQGNPIYKGEIFDPASTSTYNGVTCRTPFPGNKIPSTYVNTLGSTTIGKNLLAHYPAAQTSGTQNNYSYAYPFPTVGTTMTVRLDQNLQRNQKVYFTYNSRENVRPSTTSSWGDVAGQGRHQDFATHYLRFGYDAPIGTSMLNHLNLGYNRTNSKNIGAGVTMGKGNGYWDNQLGITGGGNGGGTTFPNINNYSSYSEWSQMGDSVDGDTIDNGYRINEAFDWIKNKHTFKFGWDYRYQVFDPLNWANQSGTINFSQFTTAGSTDTTGTTGLGQASEYLGLAGYGSTTAYVTQPKWVQSYWALFAQDDWKVTPNLTVNLGFRYDVDVPRRQAYNNTSNIDTSVLNSATDGKYYGALVFSGIGAGRDGKTGETWAKTWRHDFGPRLGFSWSPKLIDSLAGKTVVHGGYGIFYAAMVVADFGADMMTGFESTPSWSSGSNWDPAFNLATGFPSFSAPPNLSSTQANYTSPTYIAPDNGRPGMIQNWSFDIQEQVAKDMIVDVAYVGSHSTHLRSNFDNYNSTLPANLSYGALMNTPLNKQSTITTPYSSYPTSNTVGNSLRQMPQYYNFNSDCCLENKGQSTFNALEITVQRRWRDSLNLLAAYTWAKTLTDADSALPDFASWHGGGAIQNPFNSKGEKAVSNQDIPQVLTVSYLYQLPFGKGKAYLNNNKIVDEVIGGWQIGGIHRYQSGQPISFGGAPIQVSGFDGTLRWNRVKGQHLGSTYQRSGHFNPAKQATIFGIGTDTYNASTNPNPYRYFNYAALVDPNASAGATGAYVFGDTPRTTGEIRSDKYLTEDFSLVKRFTLYQDRLKLQVKGEMIDAFNRHVFQRPTTDGPSDSTAFGYVDPSAMANGNVGGAPGDGGPRRIQFTLKLEY
jgi:hypothetical protein